MSIKQQALKYLSLGFSVIPIQPGKKIPAGPWKEFQNRLMTPEEVDVLFHEGDNIALVCGDVSGVLVIDRDDYKKASGRVDISSPLQTVTPRSGFHFYFKYKEGTGNTANQHLAADIRSKGGYVLIPPSRVLQEDGTLSPYIWLEDPTPEMISALPEAPIDVLRAVYGQPEASVGIDQTSLRPRFDTSSALYVSEGGRNDKLHALALQLLNKHDEKTAWELTCGANATYNPPLPPNEVKTAFNSALKYFKEHPPERKTNTPAAMVLHPVKEKEDYTPEAELSTYDEALKIFIEGKQRGIPTAFPQLDAITGGFIPGQSYLLYADTNVGKSVYMVNLLVDLAERGIKCLYFDVENSVEMSVERILFASYHGQLTLKDWRECLESGDAVRIKEIMEHVKPIIQNISVWDLHRLDKRFQEIKWGGIKQVIDEEIKAGVQVVVLDHLHYFSPGETDHSILGEVARQINNMAAINNIVIITVAHTRKGLMRADRNGQITAARPTTDDINGSGMIARHFKNIIGLQRNMASEDQIKRCETKVYVDKTKYGPAGSFKLVYNEQSLCFEPESSIRALAAYPKTENSTPTTPLSAWESVTRKSKKELQEELRRDVEDMKKAGAEAALNASPAAAAAPQSEETTKDAPESITEESGTLKTILEPQNVRIEPEREKFDTANMVTADGTPVSEIPF